MEAMIFAAGLGSRMKPLTDSVPKALIRIGGKTLLEIVIQDLIRNGFRHIVINTCYMGEQIIDFINNHTFDAEIITSEEKELLNTGGGLKYAQKYFSGKQPILIHNVDVLSTINLRKIYEIHLQKDVIATLAVSRRETARYFLFNENGLLKGWKNKKTNEVKYTSNKQSNLNELAFSGIHVVSPEIFGLLPNEEIFSITDAYLDIASQKPVGAYIHEAADWLDVGKIEVLPIAENFLKNKKQSHE